MERIAIAPGADLIEGGSLRFRTGSGEEAFALRFQGELHAYVNRCTHRSIELDLGKGDFFHPDGMRLLCRAHGAIFDPRSGACAGGICPKRSALERVGIEELDGMLYELVG